MKRRGLRISFAVENAFVIARSKATRQSRASLAALDCVATLAMTNVDRDGPLRRMGTMLDSTFVILNSFQDPGRPSRQIVASGMRS
ncbi:hypothetical protein C8024_16620 [Sphingopyxis sp. BSNA05]|nr:hypothetical protein [Sphingopyxis sp. BSNA05]